MPENEMEGLEVLVLVITTPVDGTTYQEKDVGLLLAEALYTEAGAGEEQVTVGPVRLLITGTWAIAPSDKRNKMRTRVEFLFMVWFFNIKIRNRDKSCIKS